MPQHTDAERIALAEAWIAQDPDPETRDELATRGHKVYEWPESTWLAGAVCTIVADHKNGVLHGECMTITVLRP